MDEKKQTVTFLHGQALAKLKEAENKQQPTKPITDDRTNYLTKSINDIVSVTAATI